MADDDILQSTGRPPDFKAEVVQKLDGIVDSKALGKFADWLVSVLLDAFGHVIAWGCAALSWIAAQLIRGVAKGVNAVDPAFGEVAKAGLEALFGVSVPASSFTKLTDTGAREQVKRDVGAAMLNVLGGSVEQGDAGTIVPSTEPAKRFLGTIANFAIEGWLMGIVVELESLNYLEHFGDLKDTVGEMFGFGRLTRRVLSPFIDARIVEPAKRAVNQTFRPTLLGPSTAIRQFLRGRWEWADVANELAWAGYSDERIDALLSEAMKRPSVSDVRLLEARGEWTHDQALQTLKDDGYDDTGAQLALRVEGIKRIASQDDAIVSQLLGAYADRRIDRSTFAGGLADINLPAQERAFALELGDWRQKLNTKTLSAAQALAAVEVGILNVIDYRTALEREGYDDASVTVLELLLRQKLDTKASIDKLRADLAAQRAAEKAAQEKARAAKAAEVEAANARHARGSITDLRAAVVRGLIPIDRLEEVLSATYDADTVQIYVGLVEDDRQHYLAQQAQADAARQRAARKGLSTAQLEAGVLANVLTIDQYRSALTAQGMAAEDVQILAATLAAKQQAVNDARTKRLAALQAAAVKHIDLSRFEQLVRRGHRTIAEYAALLEQLGFDDASRAAMVELLQLKFADDAAAADLRAQASGAQGPNGLTLDQARRAVVLGVSTEQDFQRYLIDAKYTADAQVVLMAELRDDVAAADAARQRREQAAAGDVGNALPLSRLRAAAQLGIITTDVYQRRLEDAGYSSDDVAIEMDLLLQELAQTRDAEARAAAVGTKTDGAGLTLAELAHAVKLGVATIDSYQARAIALGLSQADVAIVVGVLKQEVLALKDAKSRHTQIAAELVPRGIALSDLDEQVIAGVMTVGAYEASLQELGYSADDAEYLGALLTAQLEAADAGAGV